MRAKPPTRQATPSPASASKEAAESPDALRKREGVRKGLLRISRRLTRDALRHIEHPEDADRTEDIHQVRVHCKRMRALLRLLKPVSDPDAVDEENSRLRDAARALADYRDAFVAGETLKRIFADTAPRRLRDAALLLGVRGGDARHKGDVVAAFAESARKLRETVVGIRKMPLKERGWESVAPGLARSYSRSRDCYHRCLNRGAGNIGDAFHEWRKRVKDLAYQLEIFDNAAGEFRRLRKDFRRLGTLLGEDHDYVVFAHQVREREHHYAHLATFQPVRKRLKHRLKELRQREFAMAASLFSAKPELWIIHLETAWRLWKNPSLRLAELPTGAVPPSTAPTAPASTKSKTPKSSTNAAKNARLPA